MIQTSLIVGVQFDEFDYRLFLREYHRDLRDRFASEDEDFPAYSPSGVLDDLIPQFEPEASTGRAGGRYTALQDFAARNHRLDLTMTASDFGPFEQRRSPYSFDRAYYHLGRSVCSARLKMEFPGYNAYRSTRKWPVEFVRDNIDAVIEIMPDYLWWAIHDQKDAIVEALRAPELAEVQRRIDASGYKTSAFGLYLTTLETLHMEGEELPE